MKYPQIQGLEDEKFGRLTGVKRSTFEKMISILKEADMTWSSYTQDFKKRTNAFYKPS